MSLIGSLVDLTSSCCQPAKIDWKDPSKNLTKLHPQIANPEDPEDIEEHGSFFNIFESSKITREVSLTLSAGSIGVLTYTGARG